MQTIHLESNQVPATLRAGYNGKHFKARVCETVTVPADAGLWSGGSRETYKAVELATGREVPAANHSSAPWNAGRQDRTITLQPGMAVVCHSMFCGKDMGLTFYVHPQNAATLLPAPAAELNSLQQTILNYTISRKSSYNGQDRYDMAASDFNFKARGKTTNRFPSRDEWNTAKTELVALGLLNKAGAITVKGRNIAKSV